MLEFASNARKASAAGASIARSFDKAATAATALGDSAGSLTRASYVLDTMAASSADLARNMAAARTEAAGMRTPGVPGGPRVPGGGGPAGATAEPRASGSIGTATGVATAGMLFGAYENARLTDQNVKRSLPRRCRSTSGSRASRTCAIAKWRTRASTRGYGRPH
ncbi:hypothetical protein [Paraburkholderia sp. SOS3]|uniref:hypothetical protein n=1 Tax=Paraburkholderia sp. SOS3 TaxID=1926494 RepID=UPI0012EB89F1|nr:hypothetical protein [Paraburkholderia sp. SOS3]